MFKELIIKVSSALRKNNIPYMIVGGQAVLLYGIPRLTKDIDITLGMDINRLPEITGLIKKIKLTIIPKNYRDFATRTMVLPVLDKSSNIRIDFIFSFTEYEKTAIKRARDVSLGNRKIKFASVEDIIIHKIFAGRPRDIEDIKSIVVKHPKIDRKYIRKWLKQFGRTPEHSKMPDIFNRLVSRTWK